MPRLRNESNMLVCPSDIEFKEYCTDSKRDNPMISEDLIPVAPAVGDSL